MLASWTHNTVVLHELFRNAHAERSSKVYLLALSAFMISLKA